MGVCDASSYGGCAHCRQPFTLMYLSTLDFLCNFLAYIRSTFQWQLRLISCDLALLQKSTGFLLSFLFYENFYFLWLRRFMFFVFGVLLLHLQIRKIISFYFFLLGLNFFFYLFFLIVQINWQATRTNRNFFVPSNESKKKKKNLCTYFFRLILFGNMVHRMSWETENIHTAWVWQIELWCIFFVVVALYFAFWCFFFFFFSLCWFYIFFFS